MRKEPKKEGRKVRKSMQTRAEEGGDGGEAKWWEEEEEEWQGMERGGGERERGESGRKSKPALQCPIVDVLSFLLQFDANVSLACCQTTRRLDKTKVMKGTLQFSRSSFFVPHPQKQ